MAVCEYTEICPFFTAEVGYSPELNRTLREKFCLGDNTACARLVALEFMTVEEVPDDLLPTDAVKLEQMRAEKAGKSD